MSKKVIITIARQYGSGGREIGKRLAEELKIPFYDKEIIKLAAEESGISHELFENADEKPTDSFLYALAMGAYTFGNGMVASNELSLNDQLFVIQTKIIRKIAAESSCVIVGRCADYLLKEDNDVMSIFVHAQLLDRIKRVSTIQNLPENKAKDLILKTDKKRASYCNYYSSLKWGVASNYDICLNSASVGIDTSVEILKSLALLKMQD